MTTGDLPGMGRRFSFMPYAVLTSFLGHAGTIGR
jgi:hypothetical protein